jgi:hypothetical protein
MDFCGPQRKVSRLVLAALSVLIYNTASATESPSTPASVELEIFRTGATATLSRLCQSVTRGNPPPPTVEWSGHAVEMERRDVPPGIIREHCTHRGMPRSPVVPLHNRALPSRQVEG